MLGTKFVDTPLHFDANALRISAALLHNLKQHNRANLFMDAAVFQIVAKQIFRLGRVVGKYFDNLSVRQGYIRLVDAVFLDFTRDFTRDRDTRLTDEFAGNRIDCGFCQRMPDKAAGNIQLFIIFIPPDRRKIIAFGIEKQIVDQDLRALHQRRLARPQFFVNLFERLVAERRIVLGSQRAALVFFKRRGNHRFVSEHRENIRIRLNAERADKDGDRNFSCLVDLYIKRIVDIRLIFQPRAAVRNHGSGKHMLAGFINGIPVINAGGTNDLRNDYSFRAIDDKRSIFGHHREIAHVYL